jgi:hypothetical protein
VDERGEVVLQKNLLNEPEILHEFFQGLDTVAVAMEASYAWEPVYELLERMGLKVHLAHPMKTRIIADAKLKTDMKDSEGSSSSMASGGLRPSEGDQGAQEAGEAQGLPGQEEDLGGKQG